MSIVIKVKVKNEGKGKESTTPKLGYTTKSSADTGI